MRSWVRRGPWRARSGGSASL